MTFGSPEAAHSGDSKESLEMARTRLAESSEIAERAVRYHIAEAVVLELAALRREVAALRERLETRV